jgi:hypothetical protein
LGADVLRVRRRWIAAAAFVLSACALVGCGDDPSSSDDIAAGTTAAATEPTGPASTSGPPSSATEPSVAESTAPTTGSTPLERRELVHDGVLVETFGGVTGDVARHGPDVAVYADGTVVQLAPMNASYPGPALGGYVITTVSDERLAELAERLDRDGFLSTPAERTPPHDEWAQDLRIVVHTTEGPLVHQQPDPFFDRTMTTSPDDPSGTTQPDDVAAYLSSLTDAQVAARRAMLDLADYLWSIDFAGDTFPGNPMPITAIEALIAPGPAPSDYTITNEWPIDVDLAMASDTVPGTDLHCLTITGDDLAGLLPVAEDAQGSRWEQDGTVFQVGLRVVLPHEPPCSY